MSHGFVFILNVKLANYQPFLPLFQFPCDKLLFSQEEIYRLEKGIESDQKLKHMAELQLSVVSDPASKHQIQAENLGKLRKEKYKNLFIVGANNTVGGKLGETSGGTVPIAVLHGFPTVRGTSKSEGKKTNFRI